MQTLAEVVYDDESGTTTVGGRRLRPLSDPDGDNHSRRVYQWGSSSVMKVDYDLPQSVGEWHNYWRCPARWRGYLVQPTMMGAVTVVNQGKWWTHRRSWVVQRKISIMRRYQWERRMIQAGHDRHAVIEMGEQWEDFMDDLQTCLTGWNDSGTRQWTVVGGKPMLHDYGTLEYDLDNSWFQRDNQRAVWRKLDNKWRGFEMRWCAPSRRQSELTV